MVGNVVTMIVIVVAIAHRQVGVSVRRQWAAVKTSVIGALPAWLAATGAAGATGEAPPTIALLAALTSGVAAYVFAVWLLDPRLLGEARAQLDGLRSRDAAAV
jgi:hypothetical protein